ncbi:hypothetical protein TNIN_130281 [Trichonephila inaurata madagascariensis]|uniref:Uncharacterized protein n=1 Tax=Trichonephila inaurata madagascariensis TaxID=2747483 RepID=A0A8X6XT92_9ARAC|nr:hypothetical protein TNIN_130281 [Trichonephila inaurata madagascariensis]
MDLHCVGATYSDTVKLKHPPASLMSNAAEKSSICFQQGSDRRLSRTDGNGDIKDHGEHTGGYSSKPCASSAVKNECLKNKEKQLLGKWFFTERERENCLKHQSKKQQYKKWFKMHLRT